MKPNSMTDLSLQQFHHYDPLTELPNQAYLKQFLFNSTEQIQKDNSQFVFIYLDIDNFKLINNSLGHSIGDKILQDVANRLLLVTDNQYIVTHYTGDKFIIVKRGVVDLTHIIPIIQTIISIFNSPFKIEHYTLKITASLGISIFPQDGKSYDTLIKHAEMAMYCAKDNGRNTYCFYEVQMNSRILNTMQMDHALNYATKNKEFSLVYQPLINIKNNCVIGVEALLRWENSFFGAVSPKEFLPLAEKKGLIVEIGEWVLEEACLQLKYWRQHDFPSLTMAINLSCRQFSHANLPRLLKHILKKTGIPPEALELELTESLFAQNIENLIARMKQLKALGIRISIDDFGTGYSNFTYLRKLPIDKLKIDQAFINKTMTKENCAIVKAIIKLAHSLNLKVLAEGIENEEQWHFIAANQCDFGQGFYFLMPEKPEIVSDFLRSYSKNNNSV